MRILYLECNMGASGDMLMSALYELLPDKKAFLSMMNELDKRIKVSAKKAETCGITGTRISVSICGHEEESDVEHTHNHEHTHDGQGRHGHSHSSLDGIKEKICSLGIPDDVKKNAIEVYTALAEAESRVHGIPAEQIHFHEVGDLDAVADIVGVSLAFGMLAPNVIKASPVRVGSGQIKCAHGVLPVPAPATAELLKGVPCYAGDIPGELCTPTGAALLSHFADKFCSAPLMTISGVGYGVGKKEYPAANCLRAFLGEASTDKRDEVIELCCNIDDMTAEALAYAAEKIMKDGALDVTIVPATMKKGRSGTILTVMCRPKDEQRFAAILLRETTTNGVRTRRCLRYILTPSEGQVDTRYGTIRVKYAEGYGVRRAKPEYESVAQAAASSSHPFREIWDETMNQINKGGK